MTGNSEFGYKIGSAIEYVTVSRLCLAFFFGESSPPMENLRMKSAIVKVDIGQDFLEP